MAEPEEDPAEAVQRLEAALERIAASVVRRRVAALSDPARAELASRLDALIAQLRAVLEGTEPGPAPANDAGARPAGETSEGR
jgi:hypothetical protein